MLSWRAGTRSRLQESSLASIVSNALTPFVPLALHAELGIQQRGPGVLQIFGGDRLWGHGEVTGVAQVRQKFGRFFHETS